MSKLLNSYELYFSGIYIVIAQNENNTYYQLSDSSKINDKEFLNLVLHKGYKFDNLVSEIIKANNIFFENKYGC